MHMFLKGLCVLLMAGIVDARLVSAADENDDQQMELVFDEQEYNAADKQDESEQVILDELPEQELADFDDQIPLDPFDEEIMNGDQAITQEPIESESLPVLSEDLSTQESPVEMADDFSASVDEIVDEPKEQEVPAIAMPAVVEMPAVEVEPQAEPKKPEEQGVADAPQSRTIDEIASFDTTNIDDPEGNWLLKRIWWERGREKYDKIKARVDEVSQLRMTFFEKRTELDQTLLDPFYSAIGFEQGELTVILSGLVQEISSIREKTGTLTEQERDLLTIVGTEQQTVEQLEKDVLAIKEIDNALDDALTKLMEQINLCRKYEKEAWQNLKDIARELSDKKARELYYKMDAHAKNVANILTYVQTNYADYFAQLTTIARDHTERVKNAMALLREKGIDFKERADIMKEDAAERVAQDEQEADEEEQDNSWMSRATRVATSVGSAITSLYTSFVGLVGTGYHAIMARFSNAEREQEAAVPDVLLDQKEENPDDEQII